jgi:hypothetical protein
MTSTRSANHKESQLSKRKLPFLGKERRWSGH